MPLNFFSFSYTIQRVNSVKFNDDSTVIVSGKWKISVTFIIMSVEKKSIWESVNKKKNFQPVGVYIFQAPMTLVCGRGTAGRVAMTPFRCWAMPKTASHRFSWHPPRYLPGVSAAHIHSNTH